MPKTSCVRIPGIRGALVGALVVGTVGGGVGDVVWPMLWCDVVPGGGGWFGARPCPLVHPCSFSVLETTIGEAPNGFVLCVVAVEVGDGVRVVLVVCGL